MEKGTSLTQAEWSVMECLWEAGPLTGREVTQRMEKSCGWSRSTTLTLLSRLETKDFLSRVYQGSLSLMVSALTRKQALSREELDELYELLKGLEEERRD